MPRPDPALLVRTDTGSMTFLFTPLTGAPSGWSPTVRTLRKGGGTCGEVWVWECSDVKDSRTMQPFGLVQ